MTACSVGVEIALSWWWKPYVLTLCFVAIVMGCEPDWEKLQLMWIRAMRWRFAGSRRWQSF